MAHTLHRTIDNTTLLPVSGSGFICFCPQQNCVQSQWPGGLKTFLWWPGVGERAPVMDGAAGFKSDLLSRTRIQSIVSSIDYVYRHVSCLLIRHCSWKCLNWGFLWWIWWHKAWCKKEKRLIACCRARIMINGALPGRLSCSKTSRNYVTKQTGNRTLQQCPVVLPHLTAITFWSLLQRHPYGFCCFCFLA